VLVWYILSGFGTTYQEKSGNPGLERHKASGAFTVRPRKFLLKSITTKKAAKIV
jgi:hypothetical protein